MKKDNQEEIIKEVLKRVSEGESLRAVLPLGNKLVSRTTFNQWLIDKQGLADQYARACEERADKIFEDIISIADDTTHDTELKSYGDVVEERANTEWIQRSKVRIDARKWILSKMQPKKYGDKIEIENKGEVSIKSYTITPASGKGNTD